MRTMRTLHFGVVSALVIAACKMSSDERRGGDGTSPAVTTECAGPQGGSCATCTNSTDCAGRGVCVAGGHCATPLGIDGIKNGDETDVDCGGAQSPRCTDGKGCRDPASCESASCNAGVCREPLPDDGIKNGDETDVDCGGSKAPKCAIGKTCGVGADCASRGCSYEHVCIDRPSCSPHYGGDTCGGGEPDEPDAQHESCCRSIELPMWDGAVLMDKYHVTAGRMRVFLDAVNGDVRAFVKAHRPLGWDPEWDPFVPNGWDVDPDIDPAKDPEMLQRYHSSVWHQLGGTALLTRVGRDGEPFRYGCNIAGNGVHTYRMPDEVQIETLEDIPHKYSQAVLDAKTLNCVTSLMLAAFCEWDWPGSRLPTYAETRFAWNKGDRESYKYPWGNSPAPMGYLYEDDVFGPKSGIKEPSGKYGPDAVIPPDAKGLEGDPTYANWKYNYTYPKAANNADMFPDFSAYISAPGRFPKGNGPFGHADLAGNVFDLTSTVSGVAGQHPDDREVTWGRNGAWEGHNIPFAAEDEPWTAPIMRKYAKAGGRCVMPLAPAATKHP